MNRTRRVLLASLALQACTTLRAPTLRDAEVVAYYGAAAALSHSYAKHHSTANTVGVAAVAGTALWLTGQYPSYGYPTLPARLAGAASDGPSADLTQHALFITPNGRMVELRAQRPPRTLEDEDVQSYVGTIMSALRHSGRERVMLRLHGGLTGLGESPTGNLADMRRLEADSAEGARYYPIFIDWETGLLPSYRLHAQRLWQGNELPLVYMPVKAGYNLAVDFGSAVLRSPATLLNALFTRGESYGFSSTLDSRTTAYGAACADSLVAVVRALPALASYPAGNIGFGCVHDDRDNPFVSVIKAPLALTDAILAPALDMIGTPSWGVMRRAASAALSSPQPLLAIPDLTAGANTIFDYRFAREGPVSVLLDSLAVLQKPVDVFAHSAGTMMAARMVMRRDVPFRNIVFMAAAATVRDVETQVMPRVADDTLTKFYNIVLSPACEYYERHAWGLSPRGTLLVWLDDFFNTPVHANERVAGKWDNALLLAAQTASAARPRSYLKIFGLKDTRASYGYGSEHQLPCDHGDFNLPEVPFWKESFRTP